MSKILNMQNPKERKQRRHSNEPGSAREGNININDETKTRKQEL